MRHHVRFFKGLSGGIGNGDGDWRLELASELDVEPLAYIRTSDGFLTSIHDIVPGELVPGSEGVGSEDDSVRHHVRFFNPASNRNQISRLRVINTAGVDNTTEGEDEDGTATGTWDGKAFSCTFSNIEHVRGGSGLDILVGGHGDDTFSGGGELDLFVEVGASGNDTIVDFSEEDDDVLYFTDPFGDHGLTHADIIAAARQDGGDVLIDLTRYGGGTIRLKNFSIDRLDAEDIRL